MQVQNLKDIAEREGLPDSFAQAWTLPATAVSAQPPDDQARAPPGDGAQRTARQPGARR